jgi:hypothetical protein
MEKYPIDYHALINAMTQKDRSLQQYACPICVLIKSDTVRLLEAIFYEHVNEEETHETIRNRRGLCNQHGWLLTELRGQALGVAILFRAAVDEALKQSGGFSSHLIDETSHSKARQTLSRFRRNKHIQSESLENALAPKAPCPICRSSAKRERDYVHTLAKWVTEPQMKLAFELSAGLCLPHFRQTLRFCHEQNVAQTLVNVQNEKWRKLKTELERFIDKYDYRRSQEVMGEERDSHLRAMQAMMGLPNVWGADEA